MADVALRGVHKSFGSTPVVHGIDPTQPVEKVLALDDIEVLEPRT